jgi:hypothetical protein
MTGVCAQLTVAKLMVGVPGESAVNVKATRRAYGGQAASIIGMGLGPSVVGESLVEVADCQTAAYFTGDNCQASDASPGKHLPQRRFVRPPLLEWLPQAGGSLSDCWNDAPIAASVGQGSAEKCTNIVGASVML